MTQKTLADYRALARHCQWLGPVVKDSQTKTNWRCQPGGHVWASSWGNVQPKHGCPSCADLRRGRRKGS